ncbi:MAG: sugar transferase, partial [Halocynthiibacter sp.]
VLKGEMSFVGPRPVIHKELAKYGGYQWAYLMVKPGITGLWQISGRNDVTYDERVRMDMDYLGKASFLFDARIILKTAITVLRRTGR